MWPNARISVMGGEQAASTLLHGAYGGREGASGAPLTPDEQAAFKAPILAKYEAEGNPYYATARLWDDGIIDPADTRRSSRSASPPRATRRSQPTRFGIFRM